MADPSIPSITYPVDPDQVFQAMQAQNAALQNEIAHRATESAQASAQYTNMAEQLAQATSQLAALSMAHGTPASAAGPSGPTAPLPWGLKIDMPKPFGAMGSSRKSSADVPNFLYSLEMYALAKGIQDNIMTLIPFVLEGDAKAWWRYLGDQDTCPSDWQTFREAFTSRFGDIHRERNARAKLASIKGPLAVGVLRTLLEHLFLDLPDMSEKERVHQFRSLLEGAARFQLESDDPQTLAHAFALAANAERAERLSNARAPRQEQRPRRMWNSGAGPSGPAPMELNAMQEHAGSPLTPQEKRCLSDNAGCFFCRKEHAGHFARNCPDRGKTPRDRPGNGQGRRR